MNIFMLFFHSVTEYEIIGPRFSNATLHDFFNNFIVSVALVLTCTCISLLNIVVELIPGQTLGGWVCHVIGYLGLLLTALSSSLYNYTFLIDAEEPKGIHWSVEYLQYLIKLKVGVLFTSL